MYFVTVCVYLQQPYYYCSVRGVPFSSTVRQSIVPSISRDRETAKRKREDIETIAVCVRNTKRCRWSVFAVCSSLLLVRFGDWMLRRRRLFCSSVFGCRVCLYIRSVQPSFHRRRQRCRRGWLQLSRVWWCSWWRVARSWWYRMDHRTRPPWRVSSLPRKILWILPPCKKYAAKKNANTTATTNNVFDWNNRCKHDCEKEWEHDCESVEYGGRGW